MKKNLLSVLVLALLLVNIVLTTVMMLSVMSVNSKTSELITNIATVMNLELTGGYTEESGVPQVSLADTEVYSILSAMTIPLKIDENGKQGYMVFNIAFSMNKKSDGYKTYGANVGSYQDLIKDEVLTVVSSHTEAECRGNIDQVKKEILVAVQSLFESDFIYKVSLSEVKFG